MESNEIIENRKILVCITIQENSRRLISEGSRLAEQLSADLHILHIRPGETIFENEESSQLFQDLFSYGASLGGEVHFLCSTSITETIISFIKANGITDIMIGEPPQNSNEKSNIYGKLQDELKELNIITLKRE